MPDLSALTLDDFALFARIAELRSLSAVARERAVPPSQVSRALSRIEQRCGARLVHRSTHGLALSDEGDLLAVHGVLLLAEAETLAAAFDERRADPSGLVRLATSPVLAVHLLPSLEPLLQRHPRLRVEIAADDRLVDIAQGAIDIAVRTGTPTLDGLVARPIGEHSRGIYATPSYLQQHGTPRHPEELHSHRLVANSASPALNRWPFSVQGRVLDIKVAGTLRSDNTAVVLAMALAGLGIARLNRVIVAPHVAAGRLTPVLAGFTAHQPSPIYAVMLPDRQRLPKVRACVDHLAAWFAGDNAAQQKAGAVAGLDAGAAA